MILNLLSIFSSTTQYLELFGLGKGWCLKPDNLNLANYFDIVKLVVDSPWCSGGLPNKNSSKEKSAIQIALTLECIWNCRNQVVHNGSIIDVSAILRSLEIKFHEHFTLLDTEDYDPVNPTICWSAPAPGIIKINTDAVVRFGHSSIAVVARDASGLVCKAWAKSVDSNDPVIAEALAINLALQLALLERYPNVLVESDSKVCIESIIGNSTDSLWKLDALCSDVNNLALNFMSCYFSWVKREANLTTYELAKAIVSLTSCFCCNAYSLPLSVCEACKRDALGV